MPAKKDTKDTNKKPAAAEPTMSDYDTAREEEMAFRRKAAEAGVHDAPTVEATPEQQSEAAQAQSDPDTVQPIGYDARGNPYPLPDNLAPGAQKPGEQVEPLTEQRPEN